ncbi:MAG: YqeG family HAD IIIA-type phosphatase [Coriobacteriaceae bacterium]
MALLTPDRYFSRISAIDIERDLLGCGLTHVLLDIDNTVRARDTGCVPRDVGMWLGRAREAGVSFCLLSNNWHADVYRFAGELELPIVAKALKPLPPAFLAARRKIGGAAADTVVVGDQLATDVLGAHLTGMKAYMLQPLVEQDLPHTLLLHATSSGLFWEIASRSGNQYRAGMRGRAVPRRAADKRPRRFGQGAQRRVEGASRETGRESL